MHELVEALDEGAVLLQVDTIELRDDDTFDELFDQQSQLSKAVIQQFFTDPEYYMQHRAAQQHELATAAPRLPFEIDGTATVREIQAAFRDYQVRNLSAQV